MKKDTKTIVSILALGALVIYLAWFWYTPNISDLDTIIIDACTEPYEPTPNGCCNEGACVISYGTVGSYAWLYYPTSYRVEEDYGASKVLVSDNISALITFDMISLEEYGVDTFEGVLEDYASNSSGFDNDVKLGIFFGHRGYRIQGTMFSEQHNENLFREDYVFELPSEYLAIITIIDKESKFNTSRSELAPYLENFEIGEWNLTD